ncbi:hypothetical protein [Brevundimonas sp.]|uniref:hypothetical protein n=1 Tax=Brevundimonas sp. TaxID=1871086 RepID=UPI00286D11EA|nr:hypothetical protein [Brevundimonas sp.]
MWEWIVTAGLLAGFVLVMPWAVRSMRNSRRRSGAGGMGGALLEMQSFIAPSTEHLIEAREEKVVEVAGDADPDTPRKPAALPSPISASLRRG